MLRFRDGRLRFEPVRSSPPAPASSYSSGRDSTARVNPLGLALCGLATLVAIPVLFFSGGKSSVELDASQTTAASSASASGAPTTGAADDDAAEGGAATADSLLDTVNGKSLLDGGADPDAALAAHGASTTSAVDNSLTALSSAASAAASVAPSPSAAGPSASTESASRAAISASPVPSSAAPTTPAPTTAAPAPTTSAPTTAAPTTAPAPAEPEPQPETPAPADEPEPSPDQATTVETTSESEPEAPAETTPPEPATAPEPVAGEPSADDWAALRQCESLGDYGIVSASGLYYGAYQFGIGTWNATANAAGRSDLVGVLPSEASPADQDAMAYALWTMRGWAPWPHCGRGLGLG